MLTNGHVLEIYFLLKVHFDSLYKLRRLLELQIHEIILVSIPLYRTLNSKSKYKCIHVFKKCTFERTFLTGIIQNIVDRLHREHSTYSM